jgi:hypothetical protein
MKIKHSVSNNHHPSIISSPRLWLAQPRNIEIQDTFINKKSLLDCIAQPMLKASFAACRERLDGRSKRLQDVQKRSIDVAIEVVLTMGHQAMLHWIETEGVEVVLQVIILG